MERRARPQLMNNRRLASGMRWPIPVVCFLSFLEPVNSVWVRKIRYRVMLSITR
jgi:hypothetical protein